MANTDIHHDITDQEENEVLRTTDEADKEIALGSKENLSPDEAGKIYINI